MVTIEVDFVFYQIVRGTISMKTQNVYRRYVVLTHSCVYMFLNYMRNTPNHHTCITYRTHM